MRPQWQTPWQHSRENLTIVMRWRSPVEARSFIEHIRKPLDVTNLPGGDVAIEFRRTFEDTPHTVAVPAITSIPLANYSTHVPLVQVLIEFGSILEYPDHLTESGSSPF